MGFITREATAPIADDEDCLAADVENEFAKIFNEINGGLDTDNLAAAAELVGTQIADDTIPDSKLVASTITTTQMATSAVPKHEVSTANNTGNLTDSLTIVDVPGVSSITLTPGSTSDLVLLTLQIVIEPVTGGTTPNYHWGFNIDDGVGDTDVIVGVSEAGRSGVAQTSTMTFQHAMNPSSAVSTSYKPRYLLASGTNVSEWSSAGGLDYTCSFRVMILPSK